ncbi:SIR2 family protein [Paucibacter sp. PLA-PC-4]|uniref:SIR2 family protein n=1 Tax=Paucibacter sp. PLA-PC-4 TaxID=2993655 RepID=UPI00224AB790|nr:SIR2 family protein [Paucibacter sp. PLA-PC-4]MCX2864603.1 SIR2 family protein [Paucibacter sp. PLA-PC-4]
MDFLHDPIRHLRYLRQSLAQDNESIGFFLSAGCPLSVPMPDGQWPLIPDVLNLTRHINSALEADPNYKTLCTELTKAERNHENIEDILSFLRSLILVAKGGDVRGLSEQTLDGLEKKICSEIVKKINVQLPSTETPYHRLGNWIRSIDRKLAIEIFTTNYDLLAEQSLEDNEVPYFDGFVGARRSFFDLRALEDNLIPVHWTRLWKIHGSINWYQEVKDKQRVVYRASDVKEDASHLIYPSHLKYEESRKMPYLALIDQLNRFIRRKSSFLILCGYSFNDGHLNDTIVNALKANPTAMVLGLQYGTYAKENNGAESYPEAYRLAKKQHNLNIWTFDKAIIGTNLSAWGRSRERDDADAELSQFVISKTDDADPPTYSTLVQLGDFSIFTEFLKQIIGTIGRQQDV